MRRAGAMLGIVALVMVAVLQMGSRPAEALAPSPFAGDWKAASRQTMPDAHLSIRGSAIVVLRLADPDDRLFCHSVVPGAIKSVAATGIGIMTGPKTLSTLFFYRCSDGSSGFAAALFRFPPLSATQNEMADSSGHVWTRVP